MKQIRFLQPVNIREVWKREDKNFTPWLAQEEPLRELLAECGIDLGESPSIAMEVKTPGADRSLDILVETADGVKIAIENQYSRADHDHLTRALVYGTSLEVDAILLVAEDHRPEFKQVANYLNAAALAYGAQGIPIFLVKIEVLSTENSDNVYPRFEVIAEPDQWKAAITSAAKNGNSDRQLLIYGFQDRLLPFLRESTGLFQNVRPKMTANWLQAPIGGAPGVSVYTAINQNQSNVQLWFSKVNSPKANHAGHDVMLQYKDELLAALPSYSIDWRKPGTTAMIEATINGVGYQEDPSDDQLKEISEVARVLGEHGKKYLSEIKTAMAEADE
jgi:hypothetical protein